MHEHEGYARFFLPGLISGSFFDCDLRRKILMHSVGYERTSNAGYVLLGIPQRMVSSAEVRDGSSGVIIVEK